MFCVPLCPSISNKYWYFFSFIAIVFYLNPNITGYAVQGIDYYFHDNYHGALKAYAYGSDGWQLTNYKGPATTKYEINASLANSIYSSESMQPKAFQALIIIKIWTALGCKLLAE